MDFNQSSTGHLRPSDLGGSYTFEDAGKCIPFFLCPFLCSFISLFLSAFISLYLSSLLLFVLCFYLTFCLLSSFHHYPSFIFHSLFKPSNFNLSTLLLHRDNRIWRESWKASRSKKFDRSPWKKESICIGWECQKKSTKRRNKCKKTEEIRFTWR